MHILLRDVHTDDLETLFEYQREPAAIQMAAFPGRDREAFMLHWMQNVLGGPAVIAKIIEVDGQVAGFITSFQRDSERQVGYWLGSRFWGRGIATQGLEQILHSDSSRPLYAHVAKTNIASTRVLEKCGFSVCREEVAADGVEEIVLRLECRRSG